MLKLITPVSTKSILDELIREGAQKILISALQLEVSGYVDEHKNTVDKNGHRLVVRNGQGKERSIVLPVGEISLRVPRVNDRCWSSISVPIPPHRSRHPESAIARRNWRCGKQIASLRIYDPLSAWLFSAKWAWDPKRAFVGSIL